MIWHEAYYARGRTYLGSTDAKMPRSSVRMYIRDRGRCLFLVLFPPPYGALPSAPKSGAASVPARSRIPRGVPNNSIPPVATLTQSWRLWTSWVQDLGGGGSGCFGASRRGPAGTIASSTNLRGIPAWDTCGSSSVPSLEKTKKIPERARKTKHGTRDTPPASGHSSHRGMRGHGGSCTAHSLALASRRLGAHGRLTSEYT